MRIFIFYDKINPNGKAFYGHQDENTQKSVAWVIDRCKKLVNPDFDVEIKFEDKEAVILSQMSQIRALPLFKEYPIPVLTSPSVSLGLLVEEINAIRNKR